MCGPISCRHHGPLIRLDRRVEAVPGKHVVRIHGSVRVRNDHAVELQSLDQVQRDQEDPACRQRLVPADHRRRVGSKGIFEEFPDLFKAGPRPADHRGKSFFASCRAHEKAQPLPVFLSGRAGHFHRRCARPLHGGSKAPLLLRQESREDLGDLRRGAVARHERQFPHFPAVF